MNTKPMRTPLTDTLKDQTITIIGAGNIGGALATGLVEAGYDPAHLWATAKTDVHLKPLQEKLGVHVSQDNIMAASKADILILAVKPQILGDVLQTLSPVIQSNKPLLLSIAAGFSESHFRQQVGEQAIIRGMPNTPILIRAGITALYANDRVTDEQKKIAEDIFRAVGRFVWLDKETDIDIVSALSGSGPVYFFKLIQALQEAAIAQGLPENIAQQLTLQTAMGSTQMALNTAENMVALCKQVTSPGGGTARTLEALDNGNFTSLITAALEASLKRYRELSQLTVI